MRQIAELTAERTIFTSFEAHDSLLALYANRFSQQIEVAGSEEILAAWGRRR